MSGVRSSLPELPAATLADVDRAAAADHESVIDLIRELVRTPSRSGVDPYDPIIARLESWFTEHGVTARRLNDAGEPVGLTLDIVGAHPGPHFVLDACIDTAPFGNEGAWTHPPTAAAVADGWLYGRGASDSKAATAIFAHLAARLARESDRLHGTLSVLLDADEHTGHFGGIKQFLAHTEGGIAGVMIGYPGLDHVIIGGRGVYRAELTVHGTAGHSGASKPTTGNAVEKAALLVRELTERPLPASEEDFPPPKLTVTGLRGGEPSSYTVIPDHCVIYVDLRLTPTFDEPAAQALLTNTATSVDHQWPTRTPTTIRSELSWPSYRLPVETPLVKALARAATRTTSHQPRLKVAGPSNIGCYLASRGIPATAGFGVTYRALHGTDEAIELSTIPAVQSAYHEASLTLLGEP